MAEQIKRDLNIDVDKVHGNYGEYKVLVDGVTVIDGGSKVVLGMMPAADKVVEAVRSAIKGEKRQTPNSNS